MAEFPHLCLEIARIGLTFPKTAISDAGCPVLNRYVGRTQVRLVGRGTEEGTTRWAVGA
jgi:hypothetical protein